MDIDTILNNLGLNENEIKTYKILLDNDSLAIKQLLKLTKIKRGNLYATLYLLKDKGLIEEFDKEKKKHFRPLSPEQLKILALKKENEAKSNIQNLENILPLIIKSFQITSTKPAVYYLEGIEGIQSVYEKILKTKKNLKLFASKYEKKNKEFAEVLDRQITEQFKAGIKVKALSGRYYTKDEYERRKQRNADVRTQKILALDCDILIFGDNVAITTFKEQDFITTHIVNKNIAQTMENIFDAIWMTAQNPKDYIEDEGEEVVIKIG